MKVCLVIAQLPCNVEVGPSWGQQAQRSVCLSVEWVMLTLRQIDMQYSLVIEQFTGVEDIVFFRSFESLVSGDELKAELRTLVSTNSGTIRLKEFPIDLQVEMDLHTVRSFLKSCETIKSDDVELTVKQYKTVSGGCQEVVSMSASEKGTMGLCRVFKSTLQQEGGSTGATTPPPATPEEFVGEGEVIYKEAFATKYLSNFVRSMNRTNVLFQMSTGAPLHVSYSLGHRKSTVRFILAPRTED